MTCRTCGGGATQTVIMQEGKHYSKEVCTSCGDFVKWNPKPQNEGKRRRTSKHTVESLGVNCCEICRRPKDMLAVNQTLEIHHKDHTPEHDTPDNLIVLCTFCHKQAHAYATYLHAHFIERRGA